MKFSALCLTFLAAWPAWAAELEMHPQPMADLKAVAATVESVREVAARARLGGTVISLATDEGQRVSQGQKLALVADPKLSPQVAGVDARIQALEAERDLAQTEFNRASDLFARGAGAKMRVDDTRTKLEVANRAIASAKAERAVLSERTGEGSVLAPVNGRVLKVLVTEGAVVMPGDIIASIALDSYVLRLALPERHARSIKVGDQVLVGARAMAPADQPQRAGTVRKVYPRIDNGRVMADVDVDGLGDYFVGERIAVHVATGTRPAFVLPPDAILRRMGLDTVRLKSGAEVAVQTGQIGAQGVEVLSGLADGDVVVW
jgi:RND family efflux transporter MFP subunit